MDSFMLLDKRLQNIVLTYMPKGKALDDLVNFFSIFSDGTRLKILSALSVSSMCVSDLAKLLCLNQTTVSHQLKLLKSHGAVSAKRQGKVIFYSIADDKLNEIMLWGVEYLGY
ncbi:MAG: metalloregulator ArsR/SmtB family transcription factor [Firmicutes bacterium]|nr:metalloregulator ArsR/SmtB family transcription factor [Bacillota bacterium]